MRFLSAQLSAYIANDRWLDNARAANVVAARLAAGLTGLPGVRVLMAVQANELFVAMPADTIARMRSAGYDFYDWPAPAGVTDPVVRLVAAYDMLPEDADGFLAAARA